MVYGNIGSSERLDFTIVGEAVNVTARCLEATRSLGHDYLFTEAFAQRFGRTGLRSIGQHSLRGTDTSVELLGLRPDGELVRVVGG
jgi:adenylate cyclase